METKERRRLTVTKKIRKCIACVLLATVFVYAAGCGGRDGGRIRFGAAGAGGGYYSFANAFTQMAEQENESYDFDVRTTAGSSANLRLLSEGYIDMAIAQADLIDAAYNGTGAFDGNVCDGYEAVAGLYTEACQIVVREDSGIETLDDLQSKKVSIGEEESGTLINAEQILQMSGLAEPLVEVVNLDYVDAADELKSGEIDAFFCTAGIQTSVIEELSKDCKIRLIDIDDRVIDRLLAAYDFYSEYTIHRGTYEGQEQDIHTIGVEAVLLVSTDMPDETVKELTGILFDHSGDILYATPLDEMQSGFAAASGITIPFHGGARAYYEEHGISVD